MNTKGFAAVVAVLALVGCGGQTSTPGATVTKTVETPGTAAPAPGGTKPTDKPAPSPGSVAANNAVRKARTYLDVMPFSRKELISQLKHDGFSESDATAAVDGLNVDWDDQAAKKAQTYHDMMAFSRQEMLSQLKHDGFTDAQAEHGTSSVGL